MKDIIITGASYGLGYSIAKILAKDNNHLHLVSRTMNKKIEDELSKDAKITYYKFDLKETRKIANLMNQIFNNISFKSDSIILINNAATLEPIKFSGNMNPNDIIDHININITSPTIMTSEFIKYLKSYKKSKKIINISSGAGKSPYAGWSLYCSSKASLDLFTQTVALEQDSLENGVKIVSFAPGIVETQMQTLIRAQDEKDLPLVDRFKELHNQNALLSPDYVASFIEKNLIESDFVNGDITDIRN